MEVGSWTSDANSYVASEDIVVELNWKTLQVPESDLVDSDINGASRRSGVGRVHMSVILQLKTLSSFEFFPHIRCSFEWPFENYPLR